MKWLPVLFFALFLLLPVVPSALEHHDDARPATPDTTAIEQQTITVALLDSFIPSFTSPPEMHALLDGYTWSEGTNSYCFEVTWLTDPQITAGGLDGFDVLIIPGIGKEYRRPHAVGASWKEAIREFIANGGGYFGACGGANMAAECLVPPEQRGHTSMTAWEWFMNASALGIASVQAYQDIGDPIALSLAGVPERIGQSAYIWYNLSIEGSGLCQQCPVNRSHPIFAGYDGDSRIIRWVGGPALLPTGDVSVLAWYPDENMSGPHGNASTMLHAWRYSPDPWQPLDWWDMDDRVIETHLAGKPAAISCRYGEGRVVLFGNHPEHPVWRGGRLVERDTERNRMLGLGLFGWTGREELPEDYNWWIVRRGVAWTAGIAVDDLPPISGSGKLY
ncbi:MAG: hypothetical protein ACP5FL_00125 [Thermoplasmatota archaeon]